MHGARICSRSFVYQWSGNYNGGSTIMNLHHIFAVLNAAPIIFFNHELRHYFCATKMLKRLICIVFLAIVFVEADAELDSLKVYTTARIPGEVPKIDGKLDDDAWDQVPWSVDEFIQRDPDPGKAASVQTKFKILYDDKNIYFAILSLDPEPEKIARRMSRRDGFEGDFVEVNIDSYNDKRTAFSFTASVSGVKGDEYVSNDGNNWDANWDPIWYLATSVTAEGWIAEFRIPLSQLRFGNKEEHVWGLQITRRLFRKQERSNWQYIAPDASGWVHLFGELRGITGISSQKQLEIQPYVVGKTESYQKEEGNPFKTGSDSDVNFGIDAKIGLTSDITLDLTVNPDFGQVEADPSQVNLTAFRLFFQERRPFFIEGNNTLNFPLVDFSSSNLFYSRRIGRQPQRELSFDEDEFAKGISNTTILGAAKITGKNKNGFSWGILESVTNEERATVDSAGFRRKEKLEPLTNYFVARAQQDINKGNTIVGAMFTATNRNINNPQLNFLHRSAYTGGVDFNHNWKDRMYFVSGRSIFSYVTGSPQAITATQEASERYFQRPDNQHADVNATRKSLSGTGGTVTVGKQSGSLVFETGFHWMSPELELNDVGFLAQTDQLVQWTWAQYRILKPFSIFRYMRINGSQWTTWDFDGKKIETGYELAHNFQFRNYWGMNYSVTYEPTVVSNADLRGGPALRYPGRMNYRVFFYSDERKKFVIGINPIWRKGLASDLDTRSLNLNFNYRPTNALSLSVSPGIEHNRNNLQYVDSREAEGQPKYIVGQINQTTARISVRATYMITPNLSIQYWGQPFGTAGEYSNYKVIADAGSSSLEQLYYPISSASMELNNDEYLVDENRDGSHDFVFAKPDFNFGQFRSNMVIRWEYIPGSTVFLVWTQEKNGAFYDHENSALHDRYSFDFPDKPYNIFLVKYTYRFVR
jgi:hypothetical protein